MLASSMLAALLADRFKLFPEPELVALDIPYDLRRSTQDTALKERAKRPFNPLHFPQLTPAAFNYWDHLGLARRSSRKSQEQRAETAARVRSLVERYNNLGPFDLPLSQDEQWEIKIWHNRGTSIEHYNDSCREKWDRMNSVEQLWFHDMPPITRWAWDFPTLAPAPQCFYPTEETPERLRQMQLLKWVIADCE